MKKIFLIALALVTISTVAQKKNNKDKSPEEIATKKTNKMTKKLELSNEQKAKVYDLNLELARELKMWQSKREEMKASGNEPNEKQKKEFRTKKKARFDKFDSDLKGILTVDQYKVWEQHVAEMKAKRQEKRKKQKSSK